LHRTGWAILAPNEQRWPAIPGGWWRFLPPKAHLPGEVGIVCHALADAVAAVRAEGNLPVVIAGDCTLSIGVLAGLQRETSDFSLVWYDAHGDFNTHETSPGGFIGGMPLAMLCGRGEQTIMQGAGATVHPETGVILSDGRDLDPGEAEAVNESAVTHLPDVAELNSTTLPQKPIYIHFDSDVLSLSDNPAVSYPAGGGPSLDTVAQSLAQLAETGRIAAISVTMWNPELDKENAAEQVVMDLIDNVVEQLK